MPDDSMTRDVEVVLKAKVRVNGDDLACHRVMEALLLALEHPDFRDGKISEGQLIPVNGDYVQFFFKNTYRIVGVESQMR